MAAAVVVASAAALGAPTADASQAPAPKRGPSFFAPCRERLARAPGDYDSAYCFYAATLERRAWDQGAREFVALMRAHPDNYWLPLAFGHLLRNRQPRADMAAAESRYREAAAGFGRAGDAEGEILARSNLRDILVPRGRVEEATAEVARVVEIGRSVENPTLQARAWSLEATHLLDTGGDLGHAYRLLRQTEQAVFPDGPYRLKRTCLASLGIVSFRLGRIDDALGVFARLEALAAAERDLQTQASARYNLLNTESLRESVLPVPGGHARLLARARATLQAGQSAGHAVVTLKAHRALAGLLAHAPDGPSEALSHAEQCLAIAGPLDQRQDEAACAWQAATLLYPVAPDRAGALRQRAVRATALANNPLADAQSVGRHMRFSWLTRARADAVADSLAALATLETLRALQETPASSAEAFATWTFDYYWLAGRLLQDGTDADAGVAFSIVERLRARTLADARDRARMPVDSNDPRVVTRRARLGDISKVQRALMEPGGDEAWRAAQRRELADLEARLEETERDIARAGGSKNAGPRFASLESVQAALGPGEALLSFHLGLWDTYEGEFGGGAWLLAVTRERRTVYKLPDRVHFAPIVPVFAGLLTRTDGAEHVAAARLYGDVFAAALRDLPRAVTRLILVPDGPLHRLPFDALRDGIAGEPLAARYQLVLTPSATLWLDARRSAVRSPRTLVLADPDPGGAADGAASDGQAWLEGGLRLGRLPHARRESRAARRHLEGVEVLEGGFASERALKSRDLRGYGMLHFAAHAVADEAVPERSAVVLAAGGDEEDGLLQTREIAALDLEGAVVLLSACQTASGAVLSGEGVLSLARAFFQAGARTVIGTQWPVRDVDAATFFETFYRGLGNGATVSAALAGAKQHAIRTGRSPSIWAGIVLLGEGDVQLTELRAESPRPLLVAAALAALTLGALVAARGGVRSMKP